MTWYCNSRKLTHKYFLNMRIGICMWMLLCIGQDIAINADGIIDIPAHHHEPIPIMIVYDARGAHLAEIAAVCAADISWTGQCYAEVKKSARRLSRHNVQKLVPRGFELAIILQEKNNHILWELWDARLHTMLAHDEVSINTTDLRHTAHRLTDVLWPLLTGQSGCFSSYIAYIKENKYHALAQRTTHICLAEYDGSQVTVIQADPTIHIAPRFNTAPTPLIFYSQYTPENVRLMAMNKQGKHFVVSNFNGINMVPAFSPDGKKIVYCASHGDGSCAIYLCSACTTRRITDPRANSISPVFGEDDNTIYFCSDYKSKVPYIYRMNIQTNEITPIVTGAFCSSPSFCPARNMLLYTKRTQGRMQVFVFDIITNIHTQLTFDNTDKEECSWSVCGNYLICAIEDGKNSYIAQYSFITRTWRSITPMTERCSYPMWSGPYAHPFDMFTH